MNLTRRVYLWLLGLNLFVVLFAAASALLLPSPRGWPDWMPAAWWVGAAVLSAGVLAYRRSLLARGDDVERRVAALALAALPMVWGLFAVLAFWSGFSGAAAGLGGFALLLAVLGFAMQPSE